MPNRNVIFHFVIISGLTAVLVLRMVYPFLFGEYVGLAFALSMMTQVFGVLGLILAPIGGLWFIYELWKQIRLKRGLSIRSLGFAFALASVITGSLVTAALSFVATASIGLSLGLLTLALWIYIIAKFLPGLKALKHGEGEAINPAPLYLIVLPIATLIFQLVLAAPLTERSRNHTITMSAEMIDDIEAYYAVHGRYPESLLAVWNDYHPPVVGIRQFHYELNGDAYNLVFEQPRFLLDDFGAREFVVYNRLDAHAMISHNSWILIMLPEELERTQGWFAVHDTQSPHWKYFLFD